jgi:hypothetical protein
MLKNHIPRFSHEKHSKRMPFAGLREPECQLFWRSPGHWSDCLFFSAANDRCSRGATMTQKYCHMSVSCSWLICSRTECRLKLSRFETIPWRLKLTGFGFSFHMFPHAMKPFSFIDFRAILSMFPLWAGWAVIKSAHWDGAPSQSIGAMKGRSRFCENSAGFMMGTMILRVNVTCCMSFYYYHYHHDHIFLIFILLP